MKKYILLVILFLCPMIVNASDKDIQIKSIELLEKKGQTQEISKAKYEDLKVYINLKFFELNDSAKYKIILKNESDFEYKFNSSGQSFTEENYIKYEFDYGKGEVSIKPHKESIMYVTISYDKEVEASSYVENIYINDNYIDLSFNKVEEEKESDIDPPKENDSITPPEDNEEEAIDNPNTTDIKVIATIVITCSSVVLIFYFAGKKRAIYCIAILVAISPVIIHALNIYKTEINIHVEIEKKPEIGKFYLCEENRSYQFEIGMNFITWSESKYNVDNIYIEVENNVVDYRFLVHDKADINGHRPTVNISEPLENDKIYYCAGVGECISPLSKITTNLDGDYKLAKEIKKKR